MPALNLDNMADNVFQNYQVAVAVLEVISEACRAKLITVNTYMYLECNFLFNFEFFLLCHLGRMGRLCSRAWI